MRENGWKCLNKMEYEDKVRDILQLARQAESQAEWDELAALEHSLAVAQFYRYSDQAKAHQVLDRAMVAGK